MKRITNLFLITVAGGCFFTACGSLPDAAKPNSKPTVVSAIKFSDASRSSGISFTHIPTRTDRKLMPEIMGSGVAIADVNRDGSPDMILVNSGSLTAAERGGEARTRLFINDGKGNFSDKTDEWTLPSRGYGMGAAVGDFDNDGWPDLFLTHFDGKDVLLKNTGSKFEDITKASGLGDDSWSSSSGFFDYDNDGDLDIFVVKYVNFSVETTPKSYRNRVPIYPTPVSFKAAGDKIWRNDGNARFSDVTSQVGIGSDIGKGLAVAIADINSDGAADVYVANDTTANNLWLNDGKGKFSDVAQLAGVAYNEMGREQAGMGADVSDFDFNSLPDITVTNFQNEATSVYSQNKPLLFTEQSDVVGVGAASRDRLSFGIDAFDADNDGDEDMMFVNGHVEDNINLNSETVTFAQQNSLMENIGSGKFRDISDSAGDALKDVQVSRGFATGDLNGDGAIDFVVTNNGGTAQVGMNGSSDLGGFVVLWLEGSKSNRSAIGARLVAKIGGRTIERQVMGSQSYLSMSDLRIHFGLGKAEQIDELSIYWPGSKPQTLGPLSKNAFYYIREGSEPQKFTPGERRIEP